MRCVNYARVLPVLALLVMSGCSTAYQKGHVNPLGWSYASGYKEAPGPGGLIKVTYQGSQWTLMHQVETYALYRCAEIAQRERAPYFGLYRTLPDALAGRRSSSVQPTPLLGVPHAEVHISLHHAAAPGLLSAAEVLARLGPAVRAGVP